ncbi:MAG TPA: HIT family protein [Candidatus Cybelea sp.]|nr:HIT family protein [Candidatus Cybelea sp.]
MFTLHERLAADTAPVCELALCAVRLMDDRAFPWLILVPRREAIREFHQLAPAERQLLMEEIVLAERVLESEFRPDKLNVGALGNLVPQLHIHVIARRTTDRAWPGPAWGSGSALPYAPAERASLVERLAKAFGS